MNDLTLEEKIDICFDRAIRTELFAHKIRDWTSLLEEGWEHIGEENRMFVIAQIKYFANEILFALCQNFFDISEVP
ncbi:hypothetical protein OOT00_01855 [Desulfobotulus sp. H1]|uniref:DUF86 domain-containing protein n=1 Tax=Desulfobotulus pelophilus TaxID=2823377 RepID=A0ABT3N5J4_9BACT|nr:hypothetical protein [Desulfobotulus pelophilus]MCW7752728.1 hypothetical protein [Desulfobotulus pelophilus]